MNIIILVLCFFIIIVSLLIHNINESFQSYNGLNGLNSFDKYFYINLEHRKDRKKQITNELYKMNIPEDKIVRIDAVRNKYNGHIGCCKSHIKKIEKAKEMKLNNVVVFEDDFIFTHSKTEVDEKINHFLKKNLNYDIIQLSSSTVSLNNINDKHIKRVNKASTSSGYIINKKFYDKLLDNLYESKNNLENEMKHYKKNEKVTCSKYALDQHWNKLQKKSKWYIFYPYLGKQGGEAGDSSIGKCNNKI